MKDVAAAGLGGSVLVIAPHPDDESLGCGLLLATRPDKARVHLVFVTDGSRSPEPASGGGAMAAELAALRREEALQAAAVYGLPASNVYFLGFEDGSLAGQEQTLREALVALISRLDPELVFVPFRYDRHPDHIAISRVVSAARGAAQVTAGIFEYFVYSQWRMLPGGDVRAYVDPALLRCLSPGREAVELKRRALTCHRSQTTRYFDWQSRPILTQELIDRACEQQEVFLAQDPARPGRSIFARAAPWVMLAHHVEPWLKRWKDRISGRDR